MGAARIESGLSVVVQVFETRSIKLSSFTGDRKIARFFAFKS
jgi:hypothetical protein